ncbi:MAG: sodium:solute symporter family protein, partial [Calditrichia bacterium]|nr:sodium:solute symporter family protein [Calditrichia bacterium]
VGIYFFRKNKNEEDYYVGGRSIDAKHVGLSIVATDVGGGFSIGLGGLGYVMGLSGSWLLFTGLVGAWMAAVFIIPKVKAVDAKLGMLTYPDFLEHKYGKKVALVAAAISGIGYLGFTGGQILAGTKLASATLFAEIPWDIDPFYFSLYIIAGIILLYTVLGGIKAVIYTDTIQWIILLFGLIFLAIPFSFVKIGGWEQLTAQLPAEYFTLTNVSWKQLVNWAFTIIPIWFIAMTLYQRIYACSSTKEAKKAFYIAGIFEYPIMAFMGVTLGMMSRIFFPAVEPEMGLPLLLKTSLPIGVTGIVVAAYFSAIMSTADSCLIASSGNFVNDIIQKHILKGASSKTIIRISQIVTLIIGSLTILIASSFTTVLEIILHTYSFMVSGLLVPTVWAFFGKRYSPAAAMSSMIFGGGFTLFLIFSKIKMPLELDPSIYGISLSLIIFTLVTFSVSKIKVRKEQ